MTKVEFKYDIGQAVGYVIDGVKYAGFIVALAHWGKGQDNSYSFEFIDGAGKKTKLNITELQLDGCN